MSFLAPKIPGPPAPPPPPPNPPTFGDPAVTGAGTAAAQRAAAAAGAGFGGTLTSGSAQGAAPSPNAKPVLGQAILVLAFLAATGAWAQSPPTIPPECEHVACSWPGTALNGVPFPSDALNAVWLPSGVQFSAGKIELSPDQKLARAYALCNGGWAGKPEDLECKAIITAWIKRKSDDGADRAFIDEVAKELGH